MITTYLMLAGAVLGTGSDSDLAYRPETPATTRAEASPVAAPGAPLPLDVTLKLVDEILATVEVEATLPAAHVDRALNSLVDDVGPLSHQDGLRLAFQAYYNFRAAHPRLVRNPYLYFVDFGLDNRTPRGYVFDMEAMVVVDGPFTVAHGRGSSDARDGIPTTFSNTPGSLATSLGLYLTRETYTFRGDASGSYTSMGLRLDGMSEHFNNMALPRRVVAHGAPYVKPQEAGRSEGCPAMEMERAERLLPMIAQGGLVFLFSPLDPTWMQADPWVNGTRSPTITASR